MLVNSLFTFSDNVVTFFLFILRAFRGRDCAVIHIHSIGNLLDQEISEVSIRYVLLIINKNLQEKGILLLALLAVWQRGYCHCVVSVVRKPVCPSLNLSFKHLFPSNYRTIVS